ncbi:MAG: nicotinate-nucleotide--dimethylbenzimidazole phosphoribosyltransferase [Alphaproteobacteria bacterium]|nr:nicotinate-nucleotide--dimethylbenzimidazole phosphoribosyltransferase [Alphaproteobacteria bacterium]
MPVANFEEIRAIVASMPMVDKAAQNRYWARDQILTKPRGALGRIEQIGAWYVGWKAQYPAQFMHPRVSVYAGNHGVAAQGVSAYPPEVTAQMVLNFQSGGAAVNQLAFLQDADLKVHEMALEHATQDFTQKPAMSEQECAEAMVYGMMDAAEGVDILCLGEMGIANSTSAAALCCALYGGAAKDWVGGGTGVSGAALLKKISVVEAAMVQHRAVINRGDGFEILRTFGGLELAGIVGAIIAARVGRIPVLLDGYACTAAAAVLTRPCPDALDHCLVGHLSKEPGHTRLLKQLHKEPLLDFGMGLGEASGAALALGIIKAAVATHNGMASFEEAAVSTGEA